MLKLSEPNEDDLDSDFSDLGSDLDSDEDDGDDDEKWELIEMSYCWIFQK